MQDLRSLPGSHGAETVWRKEQGSACPDAAKGAIEATGVCNKANGTMHTAVTKTEDTKPQDMPRPLVDFVSERKITRPGRVSASSEGLGGVGGNTDSESQNSHTEWSTHERCLLCRRRCSASGSTDAGSLDGAGGGAGWGGNQSPW